jgi:predicted PurR-regulated permease PerM
MDVVIAIVFAVYCLFQKETLARQGRKLVYAFLPEKTADYIVRVLRLTNATFSNFFSGQCIEVCILGSMFAISMAIFRMPYIPLVSVLVAVTAFIPVVGAWVGCVLGAFFILVANPLQALWFVIMFVVLQQIENNLIYPRVVGTSIGLSGMWVLIAVGVGGSLMGVAGMFLMIPVTSVIYTLLTEYTNKHLRNKTIQESKLEVQPPEIQRIRDRHKAKKEKLKGQTAKKDNNSEAK